MGYFGSVNKRNLKKRLKETEVDWNKIYEDRENDIRPRDPSKVILKLRAERRSEEDWPDEVHNIVDEVRENTVYNKSDIKQLSTDTKFWSDVEVNNWEIIFYLEKRI